MEQNIFFIFITILIGNILQVFIFLNALFYIFISIFAIFITKNEDIPSITNKKKFAILIPAHNEENVISYLLESLMNINYPKSLYDIYLISDHSNDRTVEIAKRFPINIFDFSDKKQKPGKATALNLATEKIINKNYDAICYFDADSLSHPEFLNAMNYYLNKGYQAIQGKQVPKNPKEGLLPKILSVGQIISNRFFQKPKSFLGMSATLHGKGICLSSEIARKYKWDENCLTEDLELQMRLIRNGIKIHWGKGAIVYDEQPLTVKQYLKRNIRWTRGSLDTANKHLKALFILLIKTGDKKILEGFLYCINVYRFSIIGLTASLIYINNDKFNFLIWFYHLIPGSELIFKLIFLAPLFFIPFIILIVDKVDKDLLIAYFFQPLLGILRIPTFIGGIFKNKINWDRTEHLSKIAISDVLPSTQLKQG